MKMATMLDDLFIKRRRSSLETAMWGAKLLVVCAGIVSTVVLLKAAIIPCVLHLTPQLWASFKTCCLSQLYIYIILNFIIITIIAASSSTSHRQNQNQNHHHPSSSSVVPSYIHNNINAPNTTDVDSKEIKDNSSSSIQSEDHELISWHDIHMVQPDHQQQSQESIHTCVMPPPTNKATTNTTTLDEYDDGDHKFEPSPDACSGDIFLTDLTDSTKMPLPVKEVEEDVNTLDSTWKAIMAGQGNPIAKHLKKSETWDTPPRLTPQLGLEATKVKVTQHQLASHCNFDENDNEVEDAATWARRELKKSDTFSDKVSLRREKSMSQEELNQRAEAFIKKINNDIRLQRLESDQRRFREIVNSG